MMMIVLMFIQTAASSHQTQETQNVQLLNHQNGQTSAVRLLLENHAHVDGVDKIFGYTLLHGAARKGYIEVVRSSLKTVLVLRL